MTLLPPSSAHAPGRFHSHLPLTFPLDRHHTLSPLAPLTPEHNEYSMRDKLKILIRSTRWRVALLTILLCDVTVLFVEILLSMFEKHPMPELEGGLSVLSLSLLGICLFELLLQFYAHGWHYWPHFFDLGIVVASFVIGCYIFDKEETHPQVIGLLITFRFGRVVRLAVEVVHIYEEKLDELREHIKSLNEEIYALQSGSGRPDSQQPRRRESTHFDYRHE